MRPPLDYTENQQTHLNALDYVLKHPYLASFQALYHATLRAVPGLYNNTSNNDADMSYAVFDLAIHLELMGLDEHVKKT